MATPGDMARAEANREDGWPYPDDDSDLKEDTVDDSVDDGGRFDDDPNPYDGTYSEGLDDWPDDFLDRDD